MEYANHTSHFNATLAEAQAHSRALMDALEETMMSKLAGEEENKRMMAEMQGIQDMKESLRQWHGEAEGLLAWVGREWGTLWDRVVVRRGWNEGVVMGSAPGGDVLVGLGLRLGKGPVRVQIHGHGRGERDVSMGCA